MTESVDRSIALTRRAERVLPGGVSSTMRGLDPPYVFTHAKGPHIWDADGREYVDFHAAWGPIILGHGDERTVRMATEAVLQMDLMGAGATELETAVAERLVRYVPCAEKVLFCGSGSEATHHAVHLARAVTKRKLVVKFQGCYHGWHDYLAANVISPAERLGMVDPLGAGMLDEALESLIVLPFNDVERFEQTMAERGEEIAAVILEPIVHTIGCVVASDAFLRSLRDQTTRFGSILIFDEVVTGFRHHIGGFQAICGVTPDLSTFGKAMANGFPVAAVCGSTGLMDRFNSSDGGDVMYGGTFNGHPVCLGACLATIDTLIENDGEIYTRFYAEGGRIALSLQQLADEIGVVLRAKNFGSVFVCYFTDREVESFDDALTNDATQYVAFHRAMIERGFFMFPMNLKRNHLMAAHTAEQIDGMLEAAEEALTEVAELVAVSR